LQCCLSPASRPVAQLAEWSAVSGQRARPGASPAAVPSLSPTPTPAAGCPLGGDAAVHRSPGRAGSRRGNGGCRSGGAAGAGRAARGPARSIPAARFFRPALPATGLLRLLSDPAVLPPTAILLLPVSSGFAASAGSGSPLALASAAGAAGPAGPFASPSAPRPATSLLIADPGLPAYSCPDPTRRKERAGSATIPPFPFSDWGDCRRGACR
jgi:hypothetical protein